MDKIFSQNTDNKLVEVLGRSQYVLSGMTVFYCFIDDPYRNIENLPEKEFDEQFTKVNTVCKQ